MNAKATSLEVPYAGYHLARDRRPDPDITSVGPGTSGGEYLRRFWHPIAYLGEISAGLPLKLRLLGEDLVLFRDHSGVLGLIEARCGHRGASLEFGVISDHGIRCAYHGWLYGADGTILEMPTGRPLECTARLYQGAYPTEVFHDLVFAYLGPPEERPPFPMYDIYTAPHITVVPAPARTSVLPCNWLQCMDNSSDPAHTAFLHAIVSGPQPGFSEQMGVLPTMDFQETPAGVRYIATRVVGDNIWVRVVDSILPSMCFVPPDNQTGGKAGISQRAFTCLWFTPIDDHTTKRLYLLFNDDRLPLKAEQISRAFGQLDDRTYDERQRKPGDYDALTSQGRVTIHDYEHLTPTDEGIIMLRNRIRAGIAAVENGGAPAETKRGSSPIRTYTQNTVVRAAGLPAGTDLRSVGRLVADSNYRDVMQPA